MNPGTSLTDAVRTWALESYAKRDSWPAPAASLPNYTESWESWVVRAFSHKGANGSGNGHGMPLGIATAMWASLSGLPVPTSSSAGLVFLPAGQGSLRPNVAFAEWLMGFPIGWTACTPSATESSPPKRRTRSATLPGGS